MASDLRFPEKEQVMYTHKKDRLYREGNGFFMLVRCGGCRNTTYCYSHSQMNISCGKCNDIILTSAGGFATVSAGCEFKKVTRNDD
ncbi:ribosomal protein S27 [Ordospora pajunii]|uniref:ribosomal protein S27 n=1 Tax=Ordospora pajunii TaxID=3039483 RepID=UPI002952655B|nr:ribosomal protein S27 [Ordospora pajunii]KAH9411595.1 ribosomal protein S27 [Ordospora pajunii]